MRIFVALSIILLLGACAGNPVKQVRYDPPASIPIGVNALLNLPPIDGPIITIALYGFGDKTGQRKPSTNFSQLSTAVTQGAESHVIRALQQAGGGKWFKVLERVSLDSLVKERQLIRSTRENFEGKDALALQPMLFAGLLLDGAIIGYDSNIESGGVGARYFGIGASKEYRTDRVSVAMRIISVSTGEILLSVAVDKTIASYKDSSDVFRFLDLGTRALEIEIGSAVNEPTNQAVRLAIEQAIVEIVKEGESKGLWEFKKTTQTTTKLIHKSGEVINTDDKNTTLQSSKLKSVPISKPDINSIPTMHESEMLQGATGDDFNVCNAGGNCFKNTADMYLWETLTKLKGQKQTEKINDK